MASHNSNGGRLMLSAPSACVCGWPTWPCDTVKLGLDDLCGIAVARTAAASAPSACAVDPFSSGICPRGTKGCTVAHPADAKSTNEQGRVDSTNSVSIGQIFTNAPGTLCLNTGSTQPMVRFLPDGTVEFGPDYTPDAAARAVWEHIGGLRPDAAVVAERDRLAERAVRVDEAFVAIERERDMLRAEVKFVRAALHAVANQDAEKHAIEAYRAGVEGDTSSAPSAMPVPTGDPCPDCGFPLVGYPDFPALGCAWCSAASWKRIAVELEVMRDEARTALRELYGSYQSLSHYARHSEPPIAPMEWDGPVVARRILEGGTSS